MARLQPPRTGAPGRRAGDDVCAGAGRGRAGGAGPDAQHGAQRRDSRRVVGRRRVGRPGGAAAGRPGEPGRRPSERSAIASTCGCPRSTRRCSVAIDEAALTLTLTADPSLFGATTVRLDGSRPDGILYRRAPSAFLNYGASWSTGGGQALNLESGLSVARLAADLLVLPVVVGPAVARADRGDRRRHPPAGALPGRRCNRGHGSAGRFAATWRRRGVARLLARSVLHPLSHDRAGGRGHDAVARGSVRQQPARAVACRCPPAPTSWPTSRCPPAPPTRASSCVMRLADSRSSAGRTT